ncbi:hypothetical protein K438DRAFT_1207071, partial [Mycena galopus ATCC 62051]
EEHPTCDTAFPYGLPHFCTQDRRATSARCCGRSAETCGDPADAVPFYRIFDASIPARFYTPNVATVTTSIKTGYALETVAAMVFATQEESTVPFYRLVDPAISVGFREARFYH